MKIVILSGANSIHTVRWANGLYSSGHEVHVISQHPVIEPFMKGVNIHLLTNLGMVGYFIMVPAVRRLLQRLQPDIVNVHYASGYGTTARLVAYRPWLLSVWGSDVYDFPYKSSIHKWLVRKNILAADAIASTSYCMAEQIRCIAPEAGEIAITPFGVEMADYIDATPVAQAQSGHWVIGTVKTMADIYGIDILIQAFSLLLKKLKYKDPTIAAQLQLRLIGGGPQTDELKQLAQQLGVANQVNFVGYLPHAKVPQALAEMDIYVALSRSESFGVAVIEAGAAARPVVVSDAGGLSEVTVQGRTGLVVPCENPQAAADAIEKLLTDTDLRLRMGIAARQHVIKHYSWPACIATMVDIYKRLIDRSKIL